MSIRAWVKKRIQELPTGEYVCKVTKRDNISAFDVLEPVVRCKDCAHYSEHEWITASNGLGTDIEDVCHFWHGKPTKVAPNGFCSWGKLRDDQEKVDK